MSIPKDTPTEVQLAVTPRQELQEERKKREAKHNMLGNAQAAVAAHQHQLHLESQILLDKSSVVKAYRSGATDSSAAKNDDSLDIDLLEKEKLQRQQDKQAEQAKELKNLMSNLGSSLNESAILLQEILNVQTKDARVVLLERLTKNSKKLLEQYDRIVNNPGYYEFKRNNPDFFQMEQSLVARVGVLNNAITSLKDMIEAEETATQDALPTYEEAIAQDALPAYEEAMRADPAHDNATSPVHGLRPEPSAPAQEDLMDPPPAYSEVPADGHRSSLGLRPEPRPNSSDKLEQEAAKALEVQPDVQVEAQVQVQPQVQVETPRLRM